MVMIHATMIFFETAQFTALGVFSVPTPMTEPVMIWGTLMGSPVTLAVITTEMVES